MSEFMPYPYRRPGGALMRFKKRKSRFTFQEVELLLSEVQKKRHILVGKTYCFCIHITKHIFESMEIMFYIHEG